jgi:hypothetical protein
MKKLFGLAGLVVLVGTFSAVQAQSNRSRLNSSGLSNGSETNELVTANSNVIAAKAERDFNKSYKNATNVQWHNTNDGGSVVNFTDGETNSKSAYNKKGQWEYTLHYFNANQVSEDARMLVKSEFRSYAITHAIEVVRFNETALLVYIDNGSRLKTVRIVNGEADVVEEYRKSK